jgi:hypothetical protein
MPSSFIPRLLTLISIAITSTNAATCEVAGGTSDDSAGIKAALASCNNGGTVVLDKTYTIGTVLQTTDLGNVAIELTGTIKLNPGTSCYSIENYGGGREKEDVTDKETDISYWKSNGVQLTYQSTYTAWTIGGSGIHIYGGGTFSGSGDSKFFLF